MRHLQISWAIDVYQTRTCADSEFGRVGGVPKEIYVEAVRFYVCNAALGTRCVCKM